MDRYEEEKQKRKRVLSGHKATIKSILKEKFGSRCWGCGQEKNKLQVDHINPVSGGAKNRRKVKMNNASLLCGPCNNKKGNKYTLKGLRDLNTSEGIKTDFSNLELEKLIEWSEKFLYNVDTHGPEARVSVEVCDIKGNVVQPIIPPKPWWKNRS